MSTATATGAKIEIRGLTKRFGTFVAVDDLCFDVEPGRITGFLGPNGAGKTTTLRMLLGLIHSTSGTATIDGQRYVDLAAPQTDGRRGSRGHQLPPRPQRPRPPAGARRRRLDPRSRGSTSCSSSPASRPRRASARVVQHGHAAAARAGGRPARRPAGARARRALERPGPRGHPLAARVPAPPEPARARRSSSPATSSRRSSRPSTRSSSSPTADSCGPAPMADLHGTPGAVIRTVRPRAPRRRAARRRRHERTRRGRHARRRHHRPAPGRRRRAARGPADLRAASPSGPTSRPCSSSSPRAPTATRRPGVRPPRRMPSPARKGRTCDPRRPQRAPQVLHHADVVGHGHRDLRGRWRPSRPCSRSSSTRARAAGPAAHRSSVTTPRSPTRSTRPASASATC